MRVPLRMPWRDRHGRLLPIKAVTLALCPVPALVVGGQWMANDLGAMPITAALHETGLWAVRFFLASLLVSPLRALVNWPQLLLIRRTLGVTSLVYALVHLSLYIVDQKYAWGMVISEILRRFYLTLGAVALIGLAVLGVTSTDAAVRRLGSWWKRMHQIGYVLGVVLLLHFFIQSKANVSQAVYAAGLYLWLMTWRLLPTPWRDLGWAMGVQALLASVLTAVVEVTWYGLTARVAVERVAMANLSLEAGIRPAHWVLLTAVVLTILVVIFRAIGSRTTEIKLPPGSYSPKARA